MGTKMPVVQEPRPSPPDLKTFIDKVFQSNDKISYGPAETKDLEQMVMLVLNCFYGDPTGQK